MHYGELENRELFIFPTHNLTDLRLAGASLARRVEVQILKISMLRGAF